MHGDLSSFFILITVVSLVFGVLQLILFFKIWGMTNKVKDIYNLMNSGEGIQEGWRFEKVYGYCHNKLNQAKRMMAIGDTKVEPLLRGFIYDLEHLDPYLKEEIEADKWIEKAKSLLCS